MSSLALHIVRTHLWQRAVLRLRRFISKCIEELSSDLVPALAELHGHHIRASHAR